MFLGTPPLIPPSASKEMFISQNLEFRSITETLINEIQTQRLRLHFAKLENDKLRQAAFGRVGKPKQTLDTSGARELTAEEHLNALQQHEQQPMLREQEKVDRQRERERQRDEQAAKKEQERSQKATDKVLGLAMTGFRAAENRLGPKQPRRRRQVADTESAGEDFGDISNPDEGSARETGPVPAPIIPATHAEAEPQPRPRPRPRRLARPPEPPLHLPPPTPHLGNTPAITAALPKYRAAQTRLPTIAGTVPHNDSIPSTSQPSHPVEPQPTHHRTVPTGVMGPPDAQNLIPGTSAAPPAANQRVTRSRAAAAGARA
ncbi:hypothetical protein BDN71DRAFT_1563517 [Pleurotus eryngii]|uniref:Uncharacterized protein n=1 Tax=Pleurotus eryngii TaxID=5323 RepID=A0A9P6D3W4_PLEER|nr:hypothetical protein BDN71DRAFT_1433833 [Pleurotus eryngii]KAF9494665.1 hypothetical protein BDN71DRAFT_1563517 [Pleurotus eryngii]